MKRKKKRKKKNKNEHVNRKNANKVVTILIFVHGIEDTICGIKTGGLARRRVEIVRGGCEGIRDRYSARGFRTNVLTAHAS